jgi:hypothetical protein
MFFVEGTVDYHALVDRFDVLVLKDALLNAPFVAHMETLVDFAIDEVV